MIPRTLNWHHNRFGISPPLLGLFSFSSTPSSSLPSTSILLFLPPALNPSLADVFDTYPPRVNAPRLMTAATVLVFRSGDVHDPNSANTQPAYGTRIHKTGPPKHNPPQPSETHTHSPLRKLKLVSSNAKVNPPSPSQDISIAPVFPPPGVMLHSEDASNKVLKAIGRSFLSVVCIFLRAHVPRHLHVSFGLG